QTQAPREAEGGQEEDAPVRQGGDPAGGVHRGAEDGQLRRGRSLVGFGRAGSGGEERGTWIARKLDDLFCGVCLGRFNPDAILPVTFCKQAGSFLPSPGFAENSFVPTACAEMLVRPKST